MPPIREYLCSYCGHQFDEFVSSRDPGEYQSFACRCGSRADLLPAVIGGYTGNMGGASSRPKNSTAMPSKKAYTGHPANVDEPESKQQEFDFNPEKKD